MSVKHTSKEHCDCPYCQKLDVMNGDPLLTKWEQDFIDSVCGYGWNESNEDYTDKQKAVIEKIFNAQKKKYRHADQYYGLDNEMPDDYMEG